jgi:hypothetical protein
MTFTYDLDLETNRDKVRLLIGDNEEGSALLADEELCFLESEFGATDDIYGTALAAIEMALTKLAGKAESKSVGPLTLSYANRQRNLDATRVRIEKYLFERAGAPTPYAGGISRDDKAIDEENPDIDKGFRVGMMDNPGGGTSRNGFTDLYDREVR